jgi:hypothetical protein
MEEFKLRVTGSDLESAKRTLETAGRREIKVQPFGSSTRSVEGAEPNREPDLAWLDVILTSPNAETALDYVRALLEELPEDYGVTPSA